MKIAVFYYTQSGQALEVAHSICKPLQLSKNNQVIFKEILPTYPFPFPWSRHEFFDAFPESRLGLSPCGIIPIDLTEVSEADLVMIVGQSWFLSPSIPLQAFFADPDIQHYLSGSRVIFVNCCRNMWLMTLLKVRKLIETAGGYLVGHIVLQDKTPNLVSVGTIIRWLLYGKKEHGWMLPTAGIKRDDIVDATRFGEIINKYFCINTEERSCPLQTELMNAGAILYKPSVLLLERLGYRMFGFWAKFIHRKGEFGNPQRQFRCTLFMIYLLLVLYLISPIGQLVFWITRPFRSLSLHFKDDCYHFADQRQPHYFQ